MAKLKMNFSEIPSNTIPAGDYPATISRVQLRESQNSAHPYLNWEFDLTDPEHAGRKVWLMTSLAPKALWRVRDEFQVLGLDITQDLEIELDDEDYVTSPSLAGHAVLIRVSIDTYQGREQNRVENIIECYNPGDEEAAGRTLV